MPQDTPDLLSLNKCNKKIVNCSFDQPHMSSDGGLLILRELLAQSPLIDTLSNAITDKRNQSYVDHSYKELIMQRIGQIICGYVDGNDCDYQKADPVLKLFADRDPVDDKDLGSQPTMCRFENSVDRKDLYRMGLAILHYSLQSYTDKPKSIIIDMDPTAHLGYGAQQLLLFNTHVGDYCHMPFHVYDGVTGKLLTAVMRPGKTPGATEILAVLKRLIREIRFFYPDLQIIFRADSHHTKPDVLDWLEDNDVHYVLGLSPNSVLKKIFKNTQERADRLYKEARKGTIINEVRQYDSDYYAAGTWRRKRRVVCRSLASHNGTDTRCVVTSFKTAMPKYLYKTVYCGRGNAELFIKDHKLGTGSDRSSCNSAEANQFRLFIHSAAYIILHELREKVLKGSELENASFMRIILQLIKTAAIVEVKKTKLHVHLPEHYRYKKIFSKVAELNGRLKAG